jgi:hypothetical protein
LAWWASVEHLLDERLVWKYAATVEQLRRRTKLIFNWRHGLSSIRTPQKFCRCNAAEARLRLHAQHLVRNLAERDVLHLMQRRISWPRVATHVTRLRKVPMHKHGLRALLVANNGAEVAWGNIAVCTIPGWATANAVAPEDVNAAATAHLARRAGAVLAVRRMRVPTGVHIFFRVLWWERRRQGNVLFKLSCQVA